jgi:hypothetical protein
MSVRVEVKWDKSQIAALQTGPLKAALRRALSKAGATALRDMRSEAVKRIRARKAIKPKYIARALTMQRQGGDIASLSWALNVSGQPVPLIAYPHRTKSGRGRKGSRTPGGVIVEVNTGKQTLVRGAFVATMKSGHEGIFHRAGRARLPIHELLGSRPVDALLHKGEADGVAARGGASFAATFERVLPMEIGKGK